MQKPRGVTSLLKLLRALPRPKHLPAPPKDETALRFRKKKGGFRCCPLGLLPTADTGIPQTTDDCGLPVRYMNEVDCFIDWWDNVDREDAKAAVDFIWPGKVKNG